MPSCFASSLFFFVTMPVHTSNRMSHKPLKGVSLINVSSINKGRGTKASLAQGHHDGKWSKRTVLVKHELVRSGRVGTHEDTHEIACKYDRKCYVGFCTPRRTIMDSKNKNELVRSCGCVVLVPCLLARLWVVSGAPANPTQP
jgi:hypothetical protein